MACLVNLLSQKPLLRSGEECWEPLASAVHGSCPLQPLRPRGLSTLSRSSWDGGSALLTFSASPSLHITSEVSICNHTDVKLWQLSCVDSWGGLPFRWVWTPSLVSRLYTLLSVPRGLPSAIHRADILCKGVVFFFCDLEMGLGEKLP